MTIKTPKSRLLMLCITRCPCGKDFENKTHNRKYCSPKCVKRFRKDWSKIKQEFNLLNPQICSNCGCNNSESLFRYCLDCRIKHRGHNKKYTDKIRLKALTKSLGI